MPDSGVKLRGVYGKPVAKAAGQKVPLTGQQLRRYGKLLLKHVREEAKKDIRGQQKRKPGEPVGLPQSKKFLDSFSYKIRGRSTVEIVSTWPTASLHTSPIKNARDLDKKRAPATPEFKMTWLVRRKVPYAKIELENGQVIIRSTPDPQKGDKLWRHPGFRHYTFLSRGIRKGREAFVRELAAEAVGQLLKTHDIFGGR